MQNSTSRVFSGAQPSGNMTLGNYIGAIKPMLEMQLLHDCLFCVVDLHALTSGIDNLKANTLKTFALFLACGLDPVKHCVFIQSTVPAHCELSWIIQTFTYMGELNRMTQFKDKSIRYEKNINAGLFTYPTLMAADILLYNANLVPVGDDQKQHLELCRNIAQRLNTKANDFFNLPKPYIIKNGSRIMSLQNPEKKMSKSDLNQHGCIFLLDEPDLIVKKIKKSVTDSNALVAADKNRPGINNLVQIYASCSNLSSTEIEDKYRNQGYGKFKTDLAEIIINELKPIKNRFNELYADPAELNKLIKSGAEKANAIANKNIKLIKEYLSLYD